MRGRAPRMLALAVALVLPGLGEEPKLNVWARVSANAQRPMTWNWAPLALQGRPSDLRIQIPRRASLDALRLRKAGLPGATVEVWGDASLDRQEEMQRFTRDFSPSLRSAADVGFGAGIGAQFLHRLMELSCDPNQNPAPAHAPSVWYNAMDPWAREGKSKGR